MNVSECGGEFTEENGGDDVDDDYHHHRHQQNPKCYMAARLDRDDY